MIVRVEYQESMIMNVIKLFLMAVTDLPDIVSSALSPPIASPLSSHSIVISLMLLGREKTSVVAVEVKFNPSALSSRVVKCPRDPVSPTIDVLV